jgi:hypothetical protein
MGIVRFEVLTAVLLRIPASLDVTVTLLEWFLTFGL